MEERIADALEILEQAMQIEQEGHEFYLKTAQRTQDEGGKNTFRTLAADERNHLSLAARQYNSLKENQVWIELPKAKAESIDADEPLFPKDTGGIPVISDAADALLFGLDIETKSYELYSRAASKTNNPQGKAVYEFLAMEEMRHFDLLMLRYDQLSAAPGWQS